MNINLLKQRARWIRQKSLEMCVSAGKGHLGGAFSCVELLVALYFTDLFRLSPKFWQKRNRDRFIFSKGHASLALYAVLAKKGFFSVSELDKYGSNGAILGGHPDHFIPGVEVSTGSLGHGLGIGCGLALAAKLNNDDFLTFVLLGDGECNEGSVWEAVMFAKAQNLGNLIAIVDDNGVGATDFVKNYLGNTPIEKKFAAFGWKIEVIDGHNFKSTLNCLKKIKRKKFSDPFAIIAKTTKGKSVSFMENDFVWHHGVPKGEYLEKARKELNE